MGISFWQIAIVVVLAILLLSRGKISDFMGDLAKGIKSFKKGMKDPTQDQPEINTSQDSSEEINTSQDSSEEESDSNKK